MSVLLTKIVCLVGKYWKDIGVCLLLSVATLSVFWQVQGHDFITFDDMLYITANPHVQEGLSLQGLAHAFTTTRGGLWIPLTWLSFMMNYEFHGLMPSAYHLTNLFLHIANSLLLFLFLRLTTGKLWASAFVAVLFAIHPLRVESVAWATERKDVLSGFFWILTLLAYFHYVNGPSLLRYATVFVSFCLGLMSKPMAVTLPFVLLLLDYWPLGRFPANTSSKQAVSGNSGLRNTTIALVTPRNAFLEKVPLLFLAVLVSLATLTASKSAGFMPSLQALPLWHRAWNAVVSYTAYMEKMIWPNPMGIVYSQPPEGFPLFRIVLSILTLVLFSTVFIRAVRHHPCFLVGWLWFLGTLLPVIGLFQAGSQAMADRFTYLPMIGLFIIVAWGIDLATEKWLYRRVILLLMLIGSTVVLGVNTFSQTAHWRDSVTLFDHTVRVTKNNFVAHYQLALALAEKRQLSKSVAHLRKALDINPNMAEAHNTLGVVLAEKGDMDKAMHHFREAIRLRPGYKDAILNLNRHLKVTGKPG